MVFVRNCLLSLALMLLISQECLVRADELDDGFVERAVQIVIRDDQATIKYSFGLTEPTMQQLLDGWAVGRPLPETDQPVDLEAVTGVSSPSVATPTSEGQVTAVEPTLTPRQADQILGNLAASLTISADGRPVDLEPVLLEPSSRHHYRYIAHFKFQLPQSNPCKLSVQDNNFRQFDGGARYALKALGATIIQQSNVMPIVVRAKRHLLNKDALDEYGEFCKIDAVLSTTRSIPDRRQ